LTKTSARSLACPIRRTARRLVTKSPIFFSSLDLSTIVEEPALEHQIAKKNLASKRVAGWPNQHTASASLSCRIDLY
jgi:hypothetical protein